MTCLDHDVLNEVGMYAADMLRSERARVEPGVVEGFTKAIEGGAVYVSGFVGRIEAEEAMNNIIKELMENVAESTGKDINTMKGLEDTNLVSWSKHLKHEDPTFSVTFNSLVKMMSKHFDCDAFATRLNVYRDGTDWKPFHHDSHAFHKASNNKEDFTMGFSLGATRDLEFMHDESGMKFGFPQRSGDVFAFSDTVNAAFQHGVPKITTTSGLRISIIAWGRRRQLTSRNSSASERRATPSRVLGQAPLCECGCREPKKKSAPAPSAKPAKKKKSRLQGGVGKK